MISLFKYIKKSISESEIYEILKLENEIKKVMKEIKVYKKPDSVSKNIIKEYIEYIKMKEKTVAK